MFLLISRGVLVTKGLCCLVNSQCIAKTRPFEHRPAWLEIEGCHALQENETEGLKAKLEAAQKVAEGARLREDEARAHGRQHAERARGSAAQVEHLEEELSTLRSIPKSLCQVNFLRRAACQINIHSRDMFHPCIIGLPAGALVMTSGQTRACGAVSQELCSS